MAYAAGHRSDLIELRAAVAEHIDRAADFSQHVHLAFRGQNLFVFRGQRQRLTPWVDDCGEAAVGVSPASPQELQQTTNI